MKKIVLIALNIFDFFHKRKIATFLKKSRFTNFKLILDVGAHKGESIDFFLTHFSVEKIISFEASPINFKDLEKKLPKEFDIIFLDSFHDANHVKKIIYYYYEKLKKDGIFYIDDISWLPYLKNNFRDNFNCEINNQETFEKLLEITKVNHENFDIYYSFVLSGAAKIIKKNDNNLIASNKIISRKSSLKNIFRSIYRKLS